jgi:hypothetical protein
MMVLAPAYLIGFLGLLLPIIIHLWSRQSKKPIPFGSLQFLQDNNLKSLRKLFPSDWKLFLVRSLIICCLVALLSDIRFAGIRSESPSRYLLDSTYASDPLVQQRLAALQDSIEIQWLPTNNLAQLAAIDRQRPTAVITPLRLSALTDNIRKVPKSNYQSWPLDPEEKNFGRLAIGQVSANFDETSISYRYNNDESGEINSVNYALISDKKSTTPAFLLAILEAIKQSGHYTLVESQSEEKADVLFVAMDTTIFSNNQKVFYLTDETYIPFLQINRNQYLLAEDIDSQDILSLGILNLIYENMNPFKDELSKFDRRVVPSQIRQKLTTLTESMKKEQANLSKIWWGLLLALIVLERWMSFK